MLRLKFDPLSGATPTQSIPLYEYKIEMVDEFPAPATHNPRPFSSRPYVILLIFRVVRFVAILSIVPRIGCQFIPSVE